MGGAWAAGLRWVAETAKTAWYLFLRRAQLVEPVFSESPAPPRVERGSAHVRRQPQPRPADHPRFAPEDPVLRVLRRRAALELFGWLGLDRLPNGYWTLLERTGDPSTALIAFISNARFDPALVRKRDAAELAAFQNFVRFVCQVEESTDLISVRQRTLLDMHTHYGEHAAVRSLLEIFVALNEAMKLCEQSEGAFRFAAVTVPARRIAALRESAVPENLLEAKALLEASQRYARSTWRFRNAAERKERIEAAARERWATLSPQDQTLLTSLLSDTEERHRALTGDADIDVEKEVEGFELRVERLAASLDDAVTRARNAAAARRAAEERTRREKQARRQQKARRQQEERQRQREERARRKGEDREVHGLSRDELLLIFGFLPGTSPELSAVRRAFIREASKSHPVPGQPDYHERNERYRFLKDAYKRLKIAFG